MLLQQQILGSMVGEIQVHCRNGERTQRRQNKILIDTVPTDLRPRSKRIPFQTRTTRPIHSATTTHHKPVPRRSVCRQLGIRRRRVRSLNNSRLVHLIRPSKTCSI